MMLLSLGGPCFGIVDPAAAGPFFEIGDPAAAGPFFEIGDPAAAGPFFQIGDPTAAGPFFGTVDRVRTMLEAYSQDVQTNPVQSTAEDHLMPGQVS